MQISEPGAHKFLKLFLSIKLIHVCRHVIKPGMETEMERNETETAHA